MTDRPTEENNRSRSTRRALLTGGAVALGGAVLGSQGTAEAANGNPWLVGRTTNAESATTKLTMSANAAAVNVTNTNTGTQGHGLLAYANTGYGLVGDSIHNQGAVVRTHSNTHWGLVAQNLASTTATNGGGGIRADGGKNIGLLATSSSNSAAIYAHSPGGAAVVAQSQGGTAVVAQSQTGGALVAITASSSDEGSAIEAVHNGSASDSAAILASGGHNVGLRVDNNSANKPVVLAQNLSGSSAGPVVVGLAGSTAAQRIHDFMGAARGAGEFAGVNGVVGVTTDNGYGVAGAAFANGGHGVHAYGDPSAGAWALVTVGNSGMLGDLSVFGNLSKPAGSFKIDHPLEPAEKYLYHSFVESPDMMNVYNGVATADAHGKATVGLPQWFETLNRDFRYQLTPIGSGAPELHVSKEVEHNSFSIADAKPHQKISWQITGIRQDAWANDNRIPVEEAKPKSERGTYLHPNGFGQPVSAGLAAKIASHDGTH